MKTPSKRPERHGKVEALTTKQLNLLNAPDLKRLANYADRRMDWLPRAHFSAEDVVQKALHAIVRGTKKGGDGRRPKIQNVQTKEAFLFYVQSAINSVVEAMKRKRELLFFHETIYREKDVEEEHRTIVLTAMVNPDEDADMVDLKTELFARLRKIAPSKLLPTIEEWERTFFWATQVPFKKKARYRLEVRKLAVRVLKDIAGDLSA